jgi:hypothetical protein
VAGIVAPGVERDTVAIADRGDDENLRRLLRTSVTPGGVRLAFTRESDFFATDGLADADVTVVARRDGRVVGSGRCSVYLLTRNAVPRRVGYLSALRVQDYTSESARLLRQGYQRLGREVAPLADGFYTSIATDNVRARRVLEHSGRLGLPSYRPLCDLVTLVGAVRSGSGGLDLAAAEESELGEFLERRAADSQLALSWEPTRWRQLEHRGIAARDFSVVRQDGRIVAAAAVWDQRSFRQTIVDGYEGWLRHVRPLLNGALALRRMPPLPVPGSVLAQGALFGATVQDSSAWPALWNLVRQRAAAAGLQWVCLSRDARDPELPMLRRLMKGQEYRTTLYEVTWQGGARWPDPWDDRLFRPEVSLL